MCVFLEDKALLSFVWLCAILASRRLIYRVLAVHLLRVCQTQGGRYAAFV